MSIVVAAKAHLAQDFKLQSIIDITPLDYEWEPGEETQDIYEGLIRAIVGQQVSTKAADSIYAKFLDLFELPYPQAEILIELDAKTLRSAGLSRQKAAYVQNVAHYFLEQGLMQCDWSAVTDEEILTQLTSIKGVGVWTVQMILMFGLNRPDVFPIGDLAIRNSMIRLYEVDESLKGRALNTQLTTIASVWQPYRTLACYYLWSWRHRW